MGASALFDIIKEKHNKRVGFKTLICSGRMVNKL